MKCPKCNSENTLNYYIKPDGEHLVLYFYRCNECIEVWEIKRCTNYEEKKCQNSPNCNGWEGYGCTGDLNLEGTSGYSIYERT